MTDAPLQQPRWGTRDRDVKAQQVFATVSHFRGDAAPLAATRWCDLGCGNGVIAATLAQFVGSINGVDQEPWPDWPQLEAQHANLSLRAGDAAAPLLAEASFDVVVCNQVYEHAADPRALIASIHRVLKPGGLCYFAGPNLLFPVEPHVLWPFVHWLPRRLAQGLLRAFGVREPLDAWSKDYWTLRRWLAAFEVTNALPFVIRHPAQVGRTSALARAAALLPEFLIRALTPLTPGFIFVLRKAP